MSAHVAELPTSMLVRVWKCLIFHYLNGPKAVMMPRGLSFKIETGTESMKYQIITRVVLERQEFSGVDYYVEYTPKVQILLVQKFSLIELLHMILF